MSISPKRLEELKNIPEDAIDTSDIPELSLFHHSLQRKKQKALRSKAFRQKKMILTKMLVNKAPNLVSVSCLKISRNFF